MDEGRGDGYACADQDAISDRACDALSLEFSELVKKRTIPFLRCHLQGGPGRTASLK